MFFKKVALLQNSEEKNLCRGFFFDKIGGQQLYQKQAPVQVFSCEVCIILKNTYGRVLLKDEQL